MKNEILNIFEDLSNLVLVHQKEVGYAFYKDYGYIRTIKTHDFEKSLYWFRQHIHRLSILRQQDDVYQVIDYYLNLINPIFEFIENEEFDELKEYELAIQKWLREINITLFYPSDPFIFISLHDTDIYRGYGDFYDERKDNDAKLTFKDHFFDRYISESLSKVTLSLESHVCKKSEINIFKRNYIIFYKEFIDRFASVRLFEDAYLFDKKTFLKNFQIKNHPMLQSTLSERLVFEEDTVRKIAVDTFVLFVCGHTTDNMQLKKEVLDFVNGWLFSNAIEYELS